MYRAPVGQPSPGAPRPGGRFPSPIWAFPGARSPAIGPRCVGSLHYGGSPSGPPGCSPGSPRGFSSRGPGGSLTGFGTGSRGYSGSPTGFSTGSRGYGGSGGKFRHRPDAFRRSQSQQGFQASTQHSDRGDNVEKYYSPSMLQDPWAGLKPVAAAAARKARYV